MAVRTTRCSIPRRILSQIATSISQKRSATDRLPLCRLTRGKNDRAKNNSIFQWVRFFAQFFTCVKPETVQIQMYFSHMLRQINAIGLDHTKMRKPEKQNSLPKAMGILPFRFSPAKNIEGRSDFWVRHEKQVSSSRLTNCNRGLQSPHGTSLWRLRRKYSQSSKICSTSTLTESFLCVNLNSSINFRAWPGTVCELQGKSHIFKDFSQSPFSSLFAQRRKINV